MNQISVDKCSFNKTNLVTKPGGYDAYKCQECGITGKRHGLSNYVTTKSVCHKHKPTVEQPPSRRIRIISEYVRTFGFQVGDELDTAEIPDQYQLSMPTSIWVYSQERRESVRLLRHEFDFI